MNFSKTKLSCNVQEDFPLNITEQLSVVKMSVGKTASSTTLWRDFCKICSLHGISYLDHERSLIRRVLWVAIIVGFLIYGMINLQGLFIQWEENVHITTIKEFSEDVTQIPFPTVTICPKGWPVDRWGFIRAYLNEFNTSNPNYNNVINKDWKFFTDKYFEYFRQGYKKLVNDLLAYQMSNPLTYEDACYPKCGRASKKTIEDMMQVFISVASLFWDFLSFS